MERRGSYGEGDRAKWKEVEGTGSMELKGMNEMERRAVGNREDGKLEQNVRREDGKEIG